MDPDGKLVIIELKRDDTGVDAHWQAIKYASYLRNANTDQIIDMLARYDGKMTKAEATERMLQHMGADDLNALNYDQRIILASHRFAPEVTSAVLWLNDKSSDENLITCVQLIPYHDSTTDKLYVQASTIIPRPDISIVGVGENIQQSDVTGGGTLGEKLRRTYRANINHPSTPFLRRVGDLAIDGLSSEIKPTRRSNWAREGNGGMRYYRLWCSWAPWHRAEGLSYRVNLWPQQDSENWRASVEFWYAGFDLADQLAGIPRYEEHKIEGHRLVASVGSDTLNDAFGQKIAATLRDFIEEITPVVNAFADAGNEEEV